jgi:hypothetical protein
MKLGYALLAANCLPYLFLALATTACAETYTWTDGNGVHFTDNLGSVPKKYREQAIAEVRDSEVTNAPLIIDMNEHPELMRSSQPKTERQRGPKKAKQFRRGQRLVGSDAIGVEKKDGCYLSYSFEPGPGTHWTPNSYSTGAMKMNVSNEADCLLDCNDNAQNQALSKAKGWILQGSCYYYRQSLSSDIRF